MVDNLPKRPFATPEVEQPPLAPDLEWMLSSSQASEAFITETIVREQYAFLVHLFLCLLDDEGEAKQTVQRVILEAVVNRRKYKGGDIKAWLASLAIEHWQRLWRADALKPEHEPLSSERLSFSRDGPYINFERRLVAGLRNLPWGDRLALILQGVLGFTEAEIAQILRWDRDRVVSRLELARRQLLQMVLDEWTHLGDKAGETRLYELLQRHWPAPQISADEIELTIVSLQAQLERQNRRTQRLKTIGQLLVALAMLVFIAFVGWLTNRYVISESPARTVVVTVVVTHQVRQQGAPRLQITGDTSRLRITEIAPLSTPVPPLFKRKPLRPDSSEAEIRLRMIESRALWHSARVEAVIVQSGPTGYIGAPRVYRNLVWLSHDLPGDGVDRRLVLSGELVGDPLYAFWIQDERVHELDVISGLSYTYPITAPDSPFYSFTNPEFLSSFGLGPRGILNGTYLFRMLFPAGLATEYGALHRIGWDKFLGRDVLVVDKVWHGVAKSRLWVDAQTGMVLRWKRLDEDDPMVDIASVTITSLELEVPFPDERWLNLALERLPHDSRMLGWRYLPSDIQPTDIFYSQKALLEPAPMPEGFDPSHSRLYFQFRPLRSPNVSLPGDIAEIFTEEGYLLGRIATGAPWDLICQRSPDGKLIAYAHASQPGREFYPLDGIHWFSLDKASEVYNVLPNAVWIGNDFAFSPNSRFLAFWGCGGNSENCGVYILDTETRKNRKLLTTSIMEEITYLTWSPDGEYLAMVKETAAGEPTSILVIQVSSAKIIYEASIVREPEGIVIPKDAPIWDWGVPFPPTRPGLEGCTEPPAK